MGFCLVCISAFYLTLSINVANDFASAIHVKLASVANVEQHVEVFVHHPQVVQVISLDHRNSKVLKCLDKKKSFNMLNTAVFSCEKLYGRKMSYINFIFKIIKIIFV